MNTREFYRLASPLLGLRDSELYDFERELRQEGLVKSTRPGPGGGIPATPASIATILVTVLAADMKRGSGKRSKGIGLLRPMRGETCPLTGAACFAEALEAIIHSPENAIGFRVLEVEVVRGLSVATIEYEDKKGKHRFSHFGVEPVDVPALAVKATLTGGALVNIATLLELGGETDAE